MAKIESGVCPYCNSTNLEYGTIQFDLFGNPYYNVECCSCGKQFQDCYSMDFQGQFLVDEETFMEKGTDYPEESKDE